jgi:hypothetical protein
MRNKAAFARFDFLLSAPGVWRALNAGVRCEYHFA